MFKPLNIRGLLDDKKSLKNVCKSVGISKTQFNNIDNYSITEYQKEVEHLKAILAEKEAVITEKERTIQILLNKL